MQYGVNVMAPTDQDISGVIMFPNEQNADDDLAILKDSSNSYATSFNAHKIHDMEVTSPSASWVSMRRAIFAHTAHVAKECGDSVSATRYVILMLQSKL